jgi:hypothetical protein
MQLTRMLAMPRSLKFLISAFALLIFVSGLEITIGVIQAARFRRNPTRTRGVHLLTGDAPDKVVARILMFRPGISSYQALLRAYAYDPNTGLSDTFWNRWILESDIRQMDDKDVTE